MQLAVFYVDVQVGRAPKEASQLPWLYPELRIRVAHAFDSWSGAGVADLAAWLFGLGKQHAPDSQFQTAIVDCESRRSVASSSRITCSSWFGDWQLVSMWAILDVRP